MLQDVHPQGPSWRFMRESSTSHAQHLVRDTGPLARALDNRHTGESHLRGELLPDRSRQRGLPAAAAGPAQSPLPGLLTPPGLLIRPAPRLSTLRRGARLRRPRPATPAAQPLRHREPAGPHGSGALCRCCCLAARQGSSCHWQQRKAAQSRSPSCARPPPRTRSARAPPPRRVPSPPPRNRSRTGPPSLPRSPPPARPRAAPPLSWRAARPAIFTQLTLSYCGLPK